MSCAFFTLLLLLVSSPFESHPPHPMFSPSSSTSTSFQARRSSTSSILRSSSPMTNAQVRSSIPPSHRTFSSCTVVVRDLSASTEGRTLPLLSSVFSRARYRLSLSASLCNSYASSFGQRLMNSPGSDGWGLESGNFVSSPGAHRRTLPILHRRLYRYTAAPVTGGDGFNHTGILSSVKLRHLHRNFAASFTGLCSLNQTELSSEMVYATYLVPDLARHLSISPEFAQNLPWRRAVLLNVDTQKTLVVMGSWAVGICTYIYKTIRPLDPFSKLLFGPNEWVYHNIWFMSGFYHLPLNGLYEFLVLLNLFCNNMDLKTQSLKTLWVGLPM